jgi:glycosyltransferase involved in cell wall biosynthesis
VLTSATAACADVAAPLAWRRVADWGFASWRLLTSALSAWPADVVHVQYQPGAYQLKGAINLLPWWLRLRAPGLALVTTFHDLRVPYLFPKAGPLRALAVSALLHGSRGAVFVDPADLERAGTGPNRRWVPIGSNIPNAPPADFQRPAVRARLGAGPSDLLVGYFGFLSASKGSTTLLRALSQLGRSGHSVRLGLIGAGANPASPTDLADERQALALAEQLGLRARLHQTGYLPAAEVSACLLACDVIALPFADGASFRRGSLLAALEHGCAIVTTAPKSSAAGAGQRRLEPGAQFLAVPPNDPAALAAALVRLVEEPALAERLGRNAQLLAARCGWAEIAAETVEVYRGAVARPGSPA